MIKLTTMWMKKKKKNLFKNRGTVPKRIQNKATRQPINKALKLLIKRPPTPLTAS